MPSWKEDMEWLRSEAKAGLTESAATVVYVLISHMRGKIHMRWYKKRHGGWRSGWEGRVTAYNEVDGYHCPGARIANLADQESWIREQLLMLGGRTVDIACRVLSGYPERQLTAPVAQLAAHAE